MHESNRDNGRGSRQKLRWKLIVPHLFHGKQARILAISSGCDHALLADQQAAVRALVDETHPLRKFSFMWRHFGFALGIAPFGRLLAALVSVKRIGR